MTAFLPIVAAPALASAAPAPADPALAAYRAVMAQKDAIEGLPNEQWHLVEAWCEEEIAALDALTEQNPGGLAALLRRLVVLSERLDGDTGWNLMDGEADLLRALGEQARKLLAGAGGGA
ncbi:MAG TPA: hypothetical protein VNZ61_16590 [Roseomonas sp.]|nr:hypothetical protein [Roseomonas sp.]